MTSRRTIAARESHGCADQAPSARARSVAALALAAVILGCSMLGCGGSTSTAGSGAPGDAGVDSGPGDARVDSAPPGDAGVDAVGKGCRPVPPSHRATAATCASNGDAGVATCGGGTMTAHDACLTDSDCGATGVCVCQKVDSTGPAPCGVSPVLGNVCAPSNCRTDADCPVCGACIPEESICGGVDGYFCETPQDTCTTNADCTAQPNGQCTYNQTAKAWACRYDIGCPG